MKNYIVLNSYDYWNIISSCTEHALFKKKDSSHCYSQFTLKHEVKEFGCDNYYTTCAYLHIL